MGVRWSRLSWSERTELWARWRRGESLRDIARALNRVSSSVYDIVGAEGGIPPRPRRVDDPSPSSQDSPHPSDDRRQRLDALVAKGPLAGRAFRLEGSRSEGVAAPSIESHGRENAL